MTQQILVVHQRRPSSCRKVCCLVASILVCTVAIAILVFGFVAVVGPHCHEKSYKEATCNSTHVGWGSENLKCNCHTEYDDKEICTEGDFPCLNIQASYKDEHGRRHFTKLYVTYSSLVSDPQCSYPACSAYDRSNEFDVPGAIIVINKNNEVLKFASDHEVGTEYTCYYNPSDYGKVISMKQYTALDSFNIIFWPLLVMIVTIVLTVVALRMCRKSDQRNGVEFNRFY